ncbi:MAG: hypothetical protein ACLUDU_02665 [Butyricimonas faecihominis]
MEARKIKQIEITKLFGYKDIKWTLNDDIEVTRKLNPNVQLIIATHSPFIAMNGWLDKITNISDITNNQ